VKTECDDQKGILEQYETRFIQVKQHIEEINSAHADQVEQITTANEEMKKVVGKQQEQIKQVDESRQGLGQKLRDLQWAKDQEEKQLHKQVDKMRGDQEEYKMTSLQDIERIKDEVSQRFKDELAHKSSEMAKLERMYTERIDILQKEVSKLHV
jgi:DNA anti-recombination protein RmuC